MERKIQVQSKTIQYIKQKYREETGKQISMPKSWEDYLDIDQDEVPAIQLPQFQTKQTPITFSTAIDALKLPTRLSFTKPPYTSFNATNPAHMIINIDLSGFYAEGITKQALRQFLSRIVDMRCLQSINLSRNSLSDLHAEEIQTLFSMKKITRIDLSRNNLGKSCLQIISKAFNHLEWVNLYRNAWIFDTIAIQGLLNAIRTNPKIFHIGLDLRDPKQVNFFCGFLKLKPHIHSFALVDSKIDVQSMQLLCSPFENNSTTRKDTSQARLFNMSFQFCYLEHVPFRMFIRSIAVNTSLINLDLSNNNLGNSLINELLKVLQNHVALCSLKLFGNLLSDEFAIQLAQCLTLNNILIEVDISNNNIGTKGAQAILLTLTEHNDTLQSLGAIGTNKRILESIIQKILKALRINKISKEIKAELIRDTQQVNFNIITNRQMEAFLQAQYQDYELLQPISVTNPLHQQPLQFNIWPI